MKTIYGIEVWPSPLLTETREGRVRGGYMNRWLIRAMVTVPSRQMIHDRLNNRIFAHPELIAEMERSLAKSYPQMGRAMP